VPQRHSGVQPGDTGAVRRQDVEVTKAESAQAAWAEHRSKGSADDTA
jgi:hypothetical protein